MMPWRRGSWRAQTLRHGAARRSACALPRAFTDARSPAVLQMLARAMTRKGNALQKKGDLEGAVAAYSKVRGQRRDSLVTFRQVLMVPVLCVQSLMEHRTADTLTRLNTAERLLKEQRQSAYEVR